MRVMSRRLAASTRRPPTAKDDLPQNPRAELIELMNQRLADAIDLQLQLKHAHWNAKDPRFVGLRELFDTVYRVVETYVDTIAERIVHMGGIAVGSVRVAASASCLDEYPLTVADGASHTDAVVRALIAFRRGARRAVAGAADLEDADTATLFAEISCGIDQWLWFIDARSPAST